MTDTNEELVCAVCKGQTTGVMIGHMPNLYHLCDHPRCSEVAKAWRNKGSGGLSNIEHQAIELAGKSGGAFLMNELDGQTDLARMSKQDFGMFIRAIIQRYRAELQRLADDGIPF